MAFLTNPRARQCVLHRHFTSGRYPVLLKVSQWPGGGWCAGCRGMLHRRGAQDVRLGPMVPPLTGDVLHHEHLPSGFSVISKNSPSRFSGRFVPTLGLQPDEVLFSWRRVGAVRCLQMCCSTEGSLGWEQLHPLGEAQCQTRSLQQVCTSVALSLCSFPSSCSSSSCRVKAAWLQPLGPVPTLGEASDMASHPGRWAAGDGSR